MQKTPKKIVHVIYLLDVGGLETVLVALINKLSPEEYSHLIICLTTYTSFKEHLCNDNVRIIALDKKPGKDVRIFFRVLVILTKEQPHVVHTYNIATLEYQFAAFLARVRLRIHAEHGKDFSDLKGENRKYNLLQKIMDPFIHFWVPASQDLANTPVQLWIIGDRPERERMQHVIDQENPSDQAVLLGVKNNMSEALNSSDGFVLTSLAEDIPMTVLEDSDPGLSVIATDTGGLPEIINDNQNGFLVPPCNPAVIATAIRNYFKDSRLLVRHDKAASRGDLTHFSLDKMTQSYIHIYTRC